MSELRVHSLSISLDGHVAGPGQSEEHPLGEGGPRLHEWVFSPEATDTDRRFHARGTDGIGATIMGRNMFGPVRGAWAGDSEGSDPEGREWTGWWGADPPFHHDVFVLTHHPRSPLTMAGGTTFHFVTDGPGDALERARAAADGADVRLGGGERLFQGLGNALDGWKCVEFAPSASVTHVRLRRP